MYLYFRAKFEVSSIILTSFRQGRGWGGGGNFIPPAPSSKRTPNKSTQISVNKYYETNP